MISINGPLMAGLIVIAPPSHYLPYTGPKVSIERPVSIVAGVCRLLGSADVAGVNSYPVACSLRSVIGCIAFLPLVDGHLITRELRHRIDDHEDAHCNGWPGNHPR